MNVNGRFLMVVLYFEHYSGFNQGFWETLTYGLIGLYKSDWIQTKGFNVRKYKHKWGGEDWDALDK